MPLSSMREVIESSATSTDLAAPAPTLPARRVRDAARRQSAADLSRSVTLRIGATSPEPSTVAPGDIAHARQRLAEALNQHFLLVEDRIDREGEALLARAENQRGQGRIRRRCTRRGRAAPAHLRD